MSRVNWPALIPPTVVAAIAVVSAVVTISKVATELETATKAHEARLARIETVMDRVADRFDNLVQRVVRVETLQETQGKR